MRVARPSRTTGRLLACVFVAAVTLVSPLESGLLPTRLADLLEPSTAQAQTRATGTPEACHTSAANPPDGTPLLERFNWMAVDLDKWNADPSGADQPTDYWLRAECLLELPACPESVLSPGTLMGLSVPSADSISRFHIGIRFAAPPDGHLYPEFCEERAVAQPELDECKNAKGLVVEVYSLPGEICRLIHPIECPTGTHRSGIQKCRAVQRRDWTCGSGYEKANQFNRCYQRGTPDPNNVHPACGPGAPAFPLDPSESYQRANPITPGTLTLSQQACAEYVGDDYAASPDCVSDFPILEPDDSLTLPSNASLSRQRQVGGSDDYWCQYHTMMLRVDCHLDSGRPSECSSPDTALCLKRVSHTGGCDRIVRTIRCRAYQADFAQGALTRQEVHDVGCEPCHTLPFEVPASGCPVYRSRRPPLRNNIDRYRIIHLAKVSFAINHRECTRHLSPNSEASATAVRDDTARCRAVPVCADPPSGRVEWSGSHPSGLAVVNSTVLFNIADIPLVSGTQPGVSYNSSSSAPQVVFKSNPQYQYFADAVGQSDIDGRAIDGRARLLTRPADTAYPNVGSLVQDECLLRENPKFNIVIEELWPATHADEIKRLFGDDALHWWEGLDLSEQATRTRVRGSLVNEEVECAYDDFRTCAWSPTRSGYYKVVGAGAWMSTRYGARSWVGGDYPFRNLKEYLKELANRDELRRILNEQGLTAVDIGVKSDWTGPLEEFSPNPLCAPLDAIGNCDADWLHTTLATTLTGCAPVDLRVRCIGNFVMANYTETEPVGLLVHEVRVNTITPD